MKEDYESVRTSKIMSLSSLSNVNNHNHESSISYTRSNSSSKLSIDNNNSIPKQSCYTASTYSFVESSVTRSKNNVSHGVHRCRSPNISTPPDSARSISATLHEDYHMNSFQPKFSESYLNSPPNSGNSLTHEHMHDESLCEEPKQVEHQCHSNDGSDNHTHDNSNRQRIEPPSKFTLLMLRYSLKLPFLHTILSEKDSRRIFYFMSLNFFFMLIQAFYGYLTDSLGLISDSIHMFFDCLALAVGLFAAVSSKWPPNSKFPFGFGKIESLSGFGNGIFLILISIEIMTEAIERLLDGRETKRLGELLTVSCLGLAVNLVGMACFGHHGHVGHGCGGHGHHHSHDHYHSQNYNNAHAHINSLPGSSQVEMNVSSCSSHVQKKHVDSTRDGLPKDTPPKSVYVASNSLDFHTQSCAHEDDNLHGIYLHVLADTMGSAAVIVSTVLIYLTGFNGWDPIASCIIAILILLSSIPLIRCSAKKLLLTLPDEREYTLRDALASVSELRGVSSYYAPRFWLVDKIEGENQVVNGVIYITATQESDLDDLRIRVQDCLKKYNVDVVIQIERNTDTNPL